MNIVGVVVFDDIILFDFLNCGNSGCPNIGSDLISPAKPAKQIKKIFK